jgi:hypothetical protein
MKAGTRTPDPKPHAADGDVPPRVSDHGADFSEPPIYFRDIAPAIEFACWVVLALAPFLRWVNGAAVTDDQFVIQVSLVIMAACGAIGLRLYNWRQSRRSPTGEVSSQGSFEK